MQYYCYNIGYSWYHKKKMNPTIGSADGIRVVFKEMAVNTVLLAWEGGTVCVEAQL